tara:strand:- start:826 stop:1287 length:462 start_codon:yes stop_codon:yes gene_type:complete
MNVTKERLRQIIEEEIRKELEEGWWPWGKSKEEKAAERRKQKYADFKKSRAAMSPEEKEARLLALSQRKKDIASGDYLKQKMNQPDAGDEMLDDISDMKRQLDPSYVEPADPQVAAFLSAKGSEKSDIMKAIPKDQRRDFLKRVRMAQKPKPQ